MAGNILLNIENEFKGLSKEKLAELATEYAVEIINEIQSDDPQLLFGILITGAMIGVCGDGVISSEEKYIACKVFREIFSVDEDTLMDILNNELNEGKYSTISAVIELGINVSLPLLRFIMCFAYVDGVLEKDVEEKIESIFGMHLLADFFMSGQESVPAPEEEFSCLENRILEIVNNADDYPDLIDDQFMAGTIEHVCAELDDVSNDEIIKAINSLCEKGIISKMETITGTLLLID